MLTFESTDRDKICKAIEICLETATQDIDDENIERLARILLTPQDTVFAYQKPG